MKIFALSIAIAFIVVLSILVAQGPDSSSGSSGGSVATSSVADGKQVVEIRAKGGFSPRVTRAKADMPTTLRVTTSGTFDCSSSLVIPRIGYQGYLPPSDVTDIPIPPQKSGTTIQGLCAMGMYTFSVVFE